MSARKLTAEEREARLHRPDPSLTMEERIAILRHATSLVSATVSVCVACEVRRGYDRCYCEDDPS